MEFKLEEPPTPDFGDLSTILCFQISKATGISSREVAQRIASSIKVDEDSLVKSVEVAGPGYLNFRLDCKRVSELTLSSIRTLKEGYGFPKTDEPEKILVEHSSVNPVHPVHIGQARNTVLGDAAASLLKARGHEVDVHFYVNDAGRQSAVVAYGYKRLGQPKPSTKPDLFLGQIYSITSCLVEIRTLKNRLKAADESLAQERKDLQEKLDEWVSVAWELQSRHPDLFAELQREISQDVDLEVQVNTILKEYEAQVAPTRSLIRQVSELCIEGFKQTFSMLGVHFDAWDWESDILWSGRVSDVLERLRRTSHVTEQNGVLRLESGKAVQELGIRQLLGIGEDYVLPSVSLTRSDGTTLYLTRDIAYSLIKFEHHSSVVNVVGMEQAHEQLHVRVALAVLGLKELARKQRHFTFGLVKFPGEKMSSRRGRVVTLDDVMDEAVKRAQLEIEKRTPDLDIPQKQRMAETIGIGAVKYALVAVEPSREVDFSWDRVLNLETSSAPFINYGYTRAKGILRKLGTVTDNVNYGKLDHPLEKRLIMKLARFPSDFVDAADRLRPDDLAGYANQLTEQFHEYYERVDVTHLEDSELKSARGALIEAVQTVIRNCMAVLGVELSERM